MSEAFKLHRIDSWLQPRESKAILRDFTSGTKLAESFTGFVLVCESEVFVSLQCVIQR